MTKITPDYDASIAFLDRWVKDGPWILVAIDPMKKAIDAATFNGHDIKALRAWLEDQGTKKKRNLYFTVNPCVRPLSTKPSREHIAGLTWLHVDVDPRAGEDIDGERSRILSLLMDPTAKGIPKPTVLLFSGGGYQAFWRLEKPHLLDGTSEAYEDAKLWNKQLELILGGDNCHNVDRIMRIPWTINRPDRKKLAKGRKETLAEVVEFNDTRHDLSKFTKAPQVQGTTAPGFSGHTVQISGNIGRISSVDELPKEVSDQAKVVIVQGIDPDNPEKFGQSRSEWLFFACCEMVRGGCDDDLIYSVITDPDFGISASVLDKGSGVESYAIRQIERAREEAIDPLLREFNDKHALIGSIGSKGICRILSEEHDPVLKRSRIAFQTQTDFMLRYKKKSLDWITADGKSASKPAAIWWLEHPKGRYYETVVFAPGMEVQGAYNLWKGFAVAADPSGSCELYLNHVHKNICDGDDVSFNYLLNWMANCVQRPAEPGQVAVVLRGEQGTGKGVFAGHFGHLLGRHFLHVTDSKHLIGSFNAHMRDCVVMYADEAFASDDQRAESMLKTLVTESRIVTEAKGVDAEETPNFIHLIMASNNKWVVPVGPHERRFLVLDVAAKNRQDAFFFNAIAREMEEGGYEALLAFLLARDLEDFDVRAFPRTGALRDQQEFSMAADDEWWYDKLQDGEIIPGGGWPEQVYCDELLYNFSTHMKENRGGRVSSIRLRRYLEGATAGLVDKVQLRPKSPLTVRQRDGVIREIERPYVFVMPTLDRCREIWGLRGGPSKWSETPREEGIPYEEIGQDDLDAEVLG